MSEFVPALETRYTFTTRPLPGGKGTACMLVFEDGVEYTLSEAMALTDERLTFEDLRAIHLVKKMFGGEIEGMIVDGVRTGIKTVIERDAGAVQEEMFDKKDFIPEKEAKEKKDDELSALGASFGEPPFIR